jgi:hypothetical protein
MMMLFQLHVVDDVLHVVDDDDVLHVVDDVDVPASCC